MSAEAALAALDRELPEPFPPAGAYVFAVRTGDLHAGHHAQITLGVSSLPVNLALELELLVEVARTG